MCNENILTGGSQNQVVKVENTVRRSVQGAPMLHAYLQYLEKAGMPGVPRFLGLDESGREILTYLPGRTMGRDFSHLHPCLYADQTVADAARFMRRLHDLSAGFVEQAIAGGWVNPYFPSEKPEIICHGDAAIWNFAFENDRIAGLFDFDQAYPGTRLWDLTSTLFSVIPLTYFAYDFALQDTVPYDRDRHAAERGRRIRLFFDAYGMDCPADVAERVAQRIQLDFVDDIEKRAAAGDKTAVGMVESGALGHYQKIVAHLKQHGHEWL